MTDTPPEVEDAYARMFARLTGTQRVRMVSDMFETAKALVMADIRANDPDISPAGLQRRLFLRLYADDVDEQTCAAVVAALQVSGPEPASSPHAVSSAERHHPPTARNSIRNGSEKSPAS